MGELELWRWVGLSGDHTHHNVCACVCVDVYVCIVHVIVLSQYWSNITRFESQKTPNTTTKSFSLLINNIISPLISVFPTTLLHAGSWEGKGAGPFRAATSMTPSSASAVSGIRKQNWKKIESQTVICTVTILTF